MCPVAPCSTGEWLPSVCPSRQRGMGKTRASVRVCEKGQSCVWHALLLRSGHFLSAAHACATDLPTTCGWVGWGGTDGACVPFLALLDVCPLCPPSPFPPRPTTPYLPLSLSVRQPSGGLLQPFDIDDASFLRFLYNAECVPFFAWLPPCACVRACVSPGTTSVMVELCTCMQRGERSICAVATKAAEAEGKRVRAGAVVALMSVHRGRLLLLDSLLSFTCVLLRLVWRARCSSSFFLHHLALPTWHMHAKTAHPHPHHVGRTAAPPLAKLARSPLLPPPLRLLSLSFFRFLFFLELYEAAMDASCWLLLRPHVRACAW